MKIWNKIPIKDNGDKLIAIPSCLKFLDPHPYFHLGAPYKDKTSIWKLREEVVNRLVKVANTHSCRGTCYKYRKTEECRFEFPRELIPVSKVEGIEIKLKISSANTFPCFFPLSFCCV